MKTAQAFTVLPFGTIRVEIDQADQRSKELLLFDTFRTLPRLKPFQ